MRAIFFRLVLVGVMSAVAPLAHSQPLSHRDLSYLMAKTIAETAIDSCAAKGYAVSAVVVDRAGEVIVAMRADNAGPHTMENARRKAYTARSFRTSTTAYAKRFADNDPVVRQQVTLPNVIAIPGGLPVNLATRLLPELASPARPVSTSRASRPGSTKSPNSLNDPSGGGVPATWRALSGHLQQEVERARHLADRAAGDAGIERGRIGWSALASGNRASRRKPGHGLTNGCRGTQAA